MYKRQGAGFTNATDAADYLVKHGLPFRDAHEILGRLVVYCEEREKGLADLSLEELRTFSPVFSEDVFDNISLDACVQRRDIPGGPSPARVSAHLDELAAFAAEMES